MSSTFYNKETSTKLHAAGHDTSPKSQARGTTRTLRFAFVRRFTGALSSVAITALAFCALSPTVALADSSWWQNNAYHGNVTRMTTPKRMNAFLVYAANARVPIEDVVPVDGIDFHTNIMGRDEKEFEAVRQEAIAFFEDRYGIDDIETNPDVFLRPYQVEPISNYRVYAISGRKVPRRGWEVRDGGWELRIINPDGLELGGEFDGEHASFGTFMVYGDYNILACKNRYERERGLCEEIILQYQSRHPVPVASLTVPDVLTFSFSCEVFSDEYGEGLAQGISAPAIVEGGDAFQYNVRNVVTFTNRGGF